MQNIITCLNKATFKEFAYYVIKDKLFIEAGNDIARIKSYVTKTISKEIVTFYKKQFVLNNIVVLGKFSEVLPHLIVLFELAQDIAFFESRIDLKNRFVIDSFIRFKCGILLSKWTNLVYLVSSNKQYLSNSAVAIDFFSFLLDNISSNCNVAIRCEKDIFEIVGKDIQKHIDNESDLIMELLMLAPSKIDIYCTDKLNNSLISTLYQLFNKKINLLA
ncbi:MAG: hypothetical protein IK070_00335 [Clostridia bacterium]|nr:hypothetical protein [Clostridia bacterium]